jgi:hypothetical protein
LDLNLMRELSVQTESKIVLLVVDGLGGLPMEPGGATELESAATPNLDRLAASSDLGLSRPVGAGISPGSGPGHLALFGYDPLRFQVGRGVLSALGVGFDLQRSDLAARINFATLDDSGRSPTAAPGASLRRRARSSSGSSTRACTSTAPRSPSSTRRSTGPWRSSGARVSRASSTTRTPRG